MPRLALFLFGAPRVQVDSLEVSICRRKSLALLAYLAVTRQPHSRDALAALFWPESNQSEARASLRRTLASLRKDLGEVASCLEADRETIELSNETWLDVEVFRQALAQWRTHLHTQNPCPACLAGLSEAANLYQDNFLEGFTLPDCPECDEWCFFEREALQRDLAAALEWLAEAHAARGGYDPAIRYARRWMVLDPLHEPAQRALMRLYALSGQRSAALRQYSECERILAEELGVEPGEETRALHQAILQRQALPELKAPVVQAKIETRYQLIEEIGRGGMGVVYRARDLHLERDVALKLLDRSTLGTEGQARLLREARAVAKLNHPNIVTVYDASELDGAPFLAMELVVGEMLRERLDAPLAEKLGWMVQVCQALEHAHAQGVLHRDLKPENLFIGTDGRVRLADFGLARYMNTRQLTQTGSLVGTPAYAAPEQLRGEPLDARADLYALGVMLYELCAGRLPFEGETLAAVITKHLHAQPASPRGVNPEISPELEALILALLAKQPGERPESAKAVRESLQKVLGDTGQALPTPRNNLPAPLTPFIGRQKELHDLAQLLADPDVRLLSITGAGGMGKTRLALEAAQAQLHGYTHGVFFVSLEALENIHSIVPAIAQALGFSFYQSGGDGQPVQPRQQLLDYLRSKQMLLLLDNFEHLLDGAGVVVDILREAPGVRILATSRTPLQLGSEVRFPLEGMAFPDPITLKVHSAEKSLAFDSVQLFLDCARRVQRDFKLAADDLGQVVRICRLAGGMPLAIRLAASWAAVLSPAEIAKEIERSLDFLESEQRDLPERQRSIQAVFEHTWKLLSDNERRIFAGLSVFRGGFSREAAAAVTGAGLRELGALSSRSLLLRGSNERYTLHRLLRLYAAQKLQEDPTALEKAKDQHSAYYCAKLAAWEKELKSAGQVAALEEMDLEIENCRAAWEWAAEQGQVARLAGGMESLYLYHLWRRRIQEADNIFSLPPASLFEEIGNENSLIIAEILDRRAVFEADKGFIEESKQIFQQSETIINQATDTSERKENAWVMHLFLMAESLVDLSLERQRVYYEKSHKLFKKMNNSWGAASALKGLGLNYSISGMAEEAVTLLNDCLILYRQIGDPRGQAAVLSRLGTILVTQGNVKKGELFQRDSIALLKAIGDVAGQISAQRLFADYTLVHSKGEFAEASKILEEVLLNCKNIGKTNTLTHILRTLGTSKVNSGRYEEGRSDWEESYKLAMAIGDLTSMGWAQCALGCLDLAEGDFAKAKNKLHHVLTEHKDTLQQDTRAISLVGLGVVACHTGDLKLAQRYVVKALRYLIEIRTEFCLVFVLPISLYLLIKQKRYEDAVEIFVGLTARFPFVAKSQAIEDIVGCHISKAAASLPPEVVAAAQARGRARDPWETTRELLAELEAESEDEQGG